MTTLFVATTGGHLHQLDRLAARLPCDSSVWVTHDNEQSRSLLANREVVFVPYVRPRRLIDVSRCLPTAHRLMQEKDITRAISTGSGIALGYLPYLAARGVECHFFESAARVDGPSTTGRLLQHARRVNLYTQYESQVDGRWAYAGSVLDAYAAVSHNPPSGRPIKVVVTTGTAREYPFGRMIEHLVPLLAPGGPLAQELGVDVSVTWQTGPTDVNHLPITPDPYMPAHALYNSLAEADIIVSHAGAGSALCALDAGRLPILVPRLAGCGEAPDDHQRQLSDELSRRGLAIARSAGTVRVEDLVLAASRTVSRDPEPPSLALGLAAGHP